MIRLKQTTIILLTLLTILTVVSALLVLLSLRTRQTVEQLESEVNQLSLDEDRFQTVGAMYQGYSTTITDWNRYLPRTEGEIAVLAAALEQLAGSRGLSIFMNFDDFPQTSNVGGKNLAGLGLDINLDGPYQSLVGFTHDLNNLPYFYRVNKLTIIQNEAGTGVKATFQGILFMHQE